MLYLSLPRDRYSTRVTTTSPPGTWKEVHVDMLDGETVIASYDRNYSGASIGANTW
jgi:hypothetical protein